MNDQERRAAILIMQQIASHPTSKYVTDSYEDILSDDVTSNTSLDFSTIIHRLQDGYYQSLIAWDEDVNSIWQKSFSTNGPSSHIGYITQYLKGKFEKASRKLLARHDYAHWGHESVRLRNKIASCIQKIPEIPVFQSYGLVPNEKVTPQLQTDSEISQYMRASRLVKDPDDQEKIVALIEKLQPDLVGNGTKVEIDVLKLYPDTIRQSIKLIREILQSQGIPFPRA